MPDWFYRTVSRPILFQVPAARARHFALGFMGRLARVPGGPQVIDFLGHMRADARLARSLLGLQFPAPIGLGPGLDGNGVALSALARFGFGFLEVGPITVEPITVEPPVERRPQHEALWFPDLRPNPGLNALAPRLQQAARSGIPILLRISPGSRSGPESGGAELDRLVDALFPHAKLFSLAVPDLTADPEAWRGVLEKVVRKCSSLVPARPALFCVPADLEPASRDAWVGAALAAGFQGLVVDGSVSAQPSGRLIGAPARAAAVAQVRGLRANWGNELPIVAGGGVHEPQDALDLQAAGANLIQLDSGLVYTGPGLPKRVNDALLDVQLRSQAGASEAVPDRPVEMSWFWTAALGAGMLIGSLMALVIAATRVVLPYDELFVGLSRAQMHAINPRLLDFMAHDRVTLAGAMIAVGTLYLGLSLFGSRRGQHWAQKTVFVSAFTGFASFFLFLGFGYLDPLHAFVTSVLMQLLLLGLHGRLGTPQSDAPPQLRGDWTWRWSHWGQLLLIVHACGLLGAGVVICGIGVTQVFVPEDLSFMHTTADALISANPQLVPLVAHDRATLGGMLLASGWGMLLPALWGYRQGSRWLWITLVVATLPAYAAALGVHLVVGYTDIGHLLPAFGGLGLFLASMALSFPFLWGETGRAATSRPTTPT